MVPPNLNKIKTIWEDLRCTVHVNKPKNIFELKELCSKKFKRKLKKQTELTGCKEWLETIVSAKKVSKY